MVKSSIAFSIGGNSNVSVLSSGPNLRSATKDHLYESSTNCLSPVKIRGKKLDSLSGKICLY